MNVANLIEVTAHDTVLGQLRTSGRMVFDGKPPVRDAAELPLEFFTLYPGPGVGSIERLSGDPATLDLVWTVVCAGADQAACLAVTAQARRLLAGFRPVDSLSCGPLVERAASVRPQWDGELANRRASLTIEFHMSATR